jgi:hypothetical protein
MLDGSAMITSQRGLVNVTDSAGKVVAAQARTTLLPTGLKLQTESKGRIFLTLSNGVALGLDASTAIEFVEYKQRPFTITELSYGLEPSTSKLKLLFSEGQIALASNRLSPLSELRIQLQQGEIRLHKGTCLISYEPTGLQITAFDGNLTYYYPDGTEREFVSAPQSIRISPQSMQRKHVAEHSEVDALSEAKKLLCQATQYASTRVFFEANDTPQRPPVPFIIARPEYFKNPPIRPYQFKD